MFYKPVILFMLFLLPGMFSLSAAELVLVKDGKANAAIILGEKPTKAAQLGAQELRNFVKLISGAELPIRTESAPEKVKIYIGNTKAAREIGLTPEKFSGETYQIKTEGDQIFLTGNDTPDFGKVNYQNYNTFPIPHFQTYGTLFAVYDFLENRCGVLFTGPWEDSIAYPRKKTLTVSPLDKKFTPPLDGFREIYTDDRNYTVLPFSERERRLWSFRWRQCEIYGKTAHNYYTLYFQYWNKAKDPNLAGEFKQKRPELFAAGYKGANSYSDKAVRSKYPADTDLPPQPCFTHPDTHKHFAEVAARYAQGKNVRGGWWNANGKVSPEKCLTPRTPGKPFFYPVEPADSNLFCKCENCKALFPDLKGDYKTSHQKFHFISEIAKKASALQKGTGISTLAYIQTLPYPDKLKLPENISVTLCLTTYSWWHPGIRAAQELEYSKWIKNEAKKRPVMLWTYIFSPHWDSKVHFQYHSFPGLYPWKNGEMMKKLFSSGVKGWFTEVELQYNLLEAYVAAKLAFDPSLDPDKIIDDWFNASYGKAAPAMKKIYRISEDAWWNKNNYPKEWTDDIAKPYGPRGAHNPYWGTGLHTEDVNWKIGSNERFNQIEALLKEASVLVKTPFEKANLQRFIKGVWEEARKGKLQYEQKMANMGKTKQKKLIPAMVSNAGGNPEKVNWSKANSTGLWLQNKDGKAHARNISMLAAADKQYLYLKYTENNPGGVIVSNRDFWSDCAELFFSEYAARPLWHIAISPAGKIEQLKFFMKDGKEEREKGKLTPRFINNLSGNTWEWMMAIPLKQLPFNQMKTGMTANFFRTLPAKEPTAAWSPLFFTLGYRNGLKQFGRISMPEIVYPESKFMLKSFCNDPAALDGKSVVTDGNKGWSMWCKLGPIEKAEYYVNLRIRTDAVDPNLTNSVGFYDQFTKKVIYTKKLKIKDYSGKDYKLFRLGPVKLSQDAFFYLGGFHKKNVNPNKVYVDQFALERVQK